MGAPSLADLQAQWAALGRQTEGGGVVLFYSERGPRYPAFSNFYAHDPWPFTVPEWAGAVEVEAAGLPVSFSTQWAEVAVMACKAAIMGDLVSYANIIEAGTPMGAKFLGRQVSPFREVLWQTCVTQVALTVVRAKGTASESFRTVLRSTGERVIAEAAPNDDVWGIGLRAEDHRCHEPAEWLGLNVLGWALMAYRSELEAAGDQPGQPARAGGTARASESREVVESTTGNGGTVPPGAKLGGGARSRHSP